MSAEPIHVPLHRTASALIRRARQPDFVLACEAVMRACSALENSTTFLIRNHRSSFQGLQLKEELLPSQRWAVDLLGKAAHAFASRKKAKLEAQMANEKCDPADPKGPDAMARRIAPLENSIKSLPKAGDFGLSSNLSVVDLAYRELTHMNPDGSRGHLLQKAIPAAMATGCREQAMERFSAFDATIKAWRKDPSKFTARPQMPGYHATGSLVTARIQAAAVHEFLSCLSGTAKIAPKPLFEDPEGQVPLRQAAFKAWDAFSTRDLEARLRHQLAWRPDSKPKTSKSALALDPQARKSKGRARQRNLQVGRLLQWRLVPDPEGVRIEAVFECHALVAPETSLGRLLVGNLAAQMSDATEKRLKSGRRPKADGSPAFSSFDSIAANAAMLHQISGFGREDLSKSAGLDLGLTNLATIAFGSGRSSLVVSGGAIEKALERVDLQIDAALSRATGFKRIAELRALRGEAPDDDALVEAPRAGQLPEGLWRELKALERQAQASPEIRKLRAKRSRLAKDIEHRLASAIIGVLSAEGVQTLVIGKNDGWKTGVDLGRTQNRRFNRIAHARLIDLLRQKGLEAGIMVATIEESWTSKTSFALNEAFPAPPKSVRRTKAIAARAAAPENSAQPKANPFERNRQSPNPAAPPTSGDPRRGLIGARRQAPGSRANSPSNCFETPSLPRKLRGWSTIHADANGAFNILRKACSGFICGRWLSPRFELFALSSDGLRAFAPSCQATPGRA